MQLGSHRQTPDLEKHENKDVSQHTALIAVVKLLRQQLAADLSISFDLVNNGSTPLTTEDVEAQYNKEFGAMVSETKQPDAENT